MLLVATALVAASVVHAMPTGGQVSSGTATMDQKGTTLTVTQTGQKLALNWQSFGIDKGETVTFSQPNSAAIAVNRVLGSDASIIYGSLSANGQVFLLNPNGIVFGKGAQVNVGGLVASTLGLSDTDFLNGKRTFKGQGTGAGGAVSNAGDIVAADGGYVALLGGQVSNLGTLQARLGTVALAAGQKVTLNFNQDKLIGIQVDQGAINALAENRQLIQADGGTVILTAKAADQLVAAVVNSSGVIRARTLSSSSGVISLIGDAQNSQVDAGGTFDVGVDAAAAAGSKAGAINVAATQVNVGSPLDWSAGTVTFNAQNNIAFNADVSASGTAKLALLYGQGAVALGNASSYGVASGVRVDLPAGANFSTKQGADGPTRSFTVITSAGAAGDVSKATLQGIAGNLAGNYVLGKDIDATATVAWNSKAGFAPLGDRTNAFTGTFDGLGHSIDGLVVNRPTTGYAGLFGYLSGGAVRNVGLTKASISGGDVVGGLVGYSNYGTVSSAYVNGNVTGGNRVGGIIGYNNYGRLSNAYATGSVAGESGVGGLVGDNSYGSIGNAYATAGVAGNQWVGGLVGINESGAIGSAYATGSVKGASAVGGLVGINDAGTIENVYASGNVSGDADVGGLIGAGYGGAVTKSYWDMEASGQLRSAGGSGLSSLQMRTAASFTGFSFASTPGNGWVIVDQDGTLNNAGGASGATTPMLVSEYTTTIANAHQLQLMALAPSADYVLARNIDAAATAGGKDVWSSAGFVPVGSTAAPYSGSFSGQTRTISGLTINAPALDNVGLFGTVGRAGSIRSLGLVSGSIVGHTAVGSLAGVNQGTIDNVYTTLAVGGNTQVGGLVGLNQGSMTNAYSTGSVSGNGQVGGLVGSNAGTINFAYAAGTVAASGATAGGLVGEGAKGTVGNGVWDIDTAAQTRSAGGSGLTAAQMQHGGSFSSAWDFKTTWVIYDGHTAPLLRTFMVPLTVTANSVVKTYDGKSYSAFGVSYSQVPDRTPLLGTLNYGGDAPGARTVGSYSILPTGLYSTQQQGGYAIDFVGGTLTVKPAVLTVVGTTAATKVYHGNSKAKLTGSLSGLVRGDAVVFRQSGSFVDKDGNPDKSVGLGKTVVYTNSLSGKDAGNYVLASSGGTTTADIVAKPLTLTDSVTAMSKVYDGTTAVTLSGGLSGVIGSDRVLLAGSFSDKNVGKGKIIKYGSANTGGPALTGKDAQNYRLFLAKDESGNTITVLPAVTADISAKSLTLSGDVTAANKVYDGTTTATLTGGLVGLVVGDAVALKGNFSDRNAGRGKTVGYDGTLTGIDAGNYTLSADALAATPTPGAALMADITPKRLSLEGVTLNADKTYDGTTVATLSGLTGIIGGDTVTFLGAFADKNVGRNKLVSYGNTLAGKDAANYSLPSQTGSIKATISAKPLTVKGSAANKVYDGTTMATLTGGLIGVVAGDQLTLTGTFDSKTVGINKTVSYRTLTGTDRLNYSLMPGTTTANITAAD